MSDERRPARGYSWPPFEPGNQLSTKHGAYADVALGPRASELARSLRERLGDDYEPRYEDAIAATAMAGARLERVEAAAQAADGELGRRLDQDARGWWKLFMHGLASLGLTRASDARIGRDRRDAGGDPLRAHIEAHYVEAVEEPKP